MTKAPKLYLCVGFIVLILYLFRFVYLKNGSHNFMYFRSEQQNTSKYNGEKGQEFHRLHRTGKSISRKPVLGLFLNETKWLKYPTRTEQSINIRKNMCPSIINMTNWKFNCQIICPIFKLSEEQTREQVNITCRSGVSNLFVGNVNRKSPVYHVTDSACLQKVISSNCGDGYLVPNIVHYIWFSRKIFNFFNFLSILSVYRLLKACFIIIHGDILPSGNLWNTLLQIVSNIIFVLRHPEKAIYGKKLLLIEHKADVARIKVLQEYGGMYLDTDEVILQSLDHLRNFPMTMSHAINNNLSNGLILATKNATFLQYWLQEYKNYNPNEWGYTSTIVPNKLSKRYPHLIHVENKTFVRPNYLQLNLLFKQNFNWSKNYAIHLYSRFYKKEHNFQDIRSLNTTIGSVARYVVYGSKELCI